MENTMSSIDSTGQQTDATGGIENAVNCTTAYLDERRRHHRPSGPAATLRGAATNLFVEWGVVCSSAQQVPTTSNVLLVADRTASISTKL